MPFSAPSGFVPVYAQLLKSGELPDRVLMAAEMLHNCKGCGWTCQVDRIMGKLGVCKSGSLAMVSSYGAHMGEERPLSGWRGSGTIFFNRCNLHCQYCQNFTISQTDLGEPVDAESLALMMLSLQEDGCHNINLVSPTHFVPQIIAGICVAAQAGLHIPIVYNTGGYDSLESLALLDGIIDIYMPDMKYANPQTAWRYSKVRNYPVVNQEAVIEMHRQVGDLRINTDGIACRGLLVRHLVLPNRLAGTVEIVQFLADQISRNTYINIMDQYHPAFNAKQFPSINRPISAKEYQEALDSALQAGLTRLDKPHHAYYFSL